MYIKNKRNSSNIKACSSFEFSCKQKDLCFEIAYFSYTFRSRSSVRLRLGYYLQSPPRRALSTSSAGTTLADHNLELICSYYYYSLFFSAVTDHSVTIIYFFHKYFIHNILPYTCLPKIHRRQRKGDCGRILGPVA